MHSIKPIFRNNLLETRGCWIKRFFGLQEKRYNDLWRDWKSDGKFEIMHSLIFRIKLQIYDIEWQNEKLKFKSDFDILNQ